MDVAAIDPVRLVPVAFGTAIVIGTALLSLPVATAQGARPRLIDALFTATSAVCVTGLATVDTGTYWSTFGQLVILILIQLGGLGVMVWAAALTLALTRRLGYRTRLAVHTETKSRPGRDLRRLVRGVIALSLTVELLLATVLALRFFTTYDMAATSSAYSGFFHAVSAFNNAGFSLYSDSLMGFADDPVVLLPIAAAVIVGGLGFFVVLELKDSWRRPRRWSIVTRVTVTMTLGLLVIGALLIGLSEMGNPATLGPLSPAERVLSSFFASVMPRTAGFNAIDVAAMRPESLFITELLMFIGGGSGGTAGGVKVTTVGLLLAVVWSEVTGRRDVEVGHRRIPVAQQRQALAVATLSAVFVVLAIFAVMTVTDAALGAVVFEVVSAFGTVGLSTGITASLPTAALAALIVLMFVGRLGPLAFATALARRDRDSKRQLPEEGMTIG